MRVVILAGGRGTRLSEETVVRPKPLVDIGGKPMIWHIMNVYASHGFKRFLVACGYKSELVKEYFANFYMHNHDFMIDMKTGQREVVSSPTIDWQIGVIDTGVETMTGGRIKRLQTWLSGGTFLATYGDGLTDADLGSVLSFHRSHGRLATVTAVRPPSRFGGLVLEDDVVREFSEKPQVGEGWINGGYFVFEPGVLDYIDGDATSLEHEPLERLTADGQLMAFRHTGFWQPMDTARDRNLLESLWASGRAPWKTWE